MCKAIQRKESRVCLPDVTIMKPDSYDISTPSRLYPTENEAKKRDTNEFAFLSDREKLQGIISGLCRILHHPVAVIDYNALGKTEIADKLESMVEMFPMRRSCSLFRKCATEDYCKECDSFYAKCMGKNRAEIEARIQENIGSAPEDYIKAAYQERPPQLLEGYNRPVIEYRCPMLGYRELLFPLYYKGRVYGVIFAGQIMVYEEGDQIINAEISSSFFKRKSQEELFSAFVESYNAQLGMKALDCDRIRRLIINSDQDAKVYDDILCLKPSPDAVIEYYSKSFRTSEEYSAFIRRVCEAIQDAEKEISEIYEEKRSRLIVQMVRSIARRYYENYEAVSVREYSNKHEQRTAELKSAWEALRVFARDMKRKFDGLVKSIVVFGNGQVLRIEDSTKKEVVFSVPANQFHKGWYDFSLVDRISGISDHKISLNNPEILGGLSEHLPKKDGVLIQCHSIAMLIQVKDLAENKRLIQYLVDAVGRELVRINSVISLCSANLMKEKYLLTLRMYRHENAHISTRLMGNINRYFSNAGQRFMVADETKRELVCNDLKNTVQLISNIADNIGFVTGANIPQGKPVRCDIVDMLYKWQIMFQAELENRNLDIIVYRGGNDASAIGTYHSYSFITRLARDITQREGDYALAPREITIDARLFELLVYNIVDNAVKYAYRGTNIYLIWSRVGEDYELSVTSYGPKMPDGDAMYGLYVRGIEASQPGQGDGLGLFVVSKIADLLGLRVTHSSERISEYNVPLIPWYSRADFSRVKGYSKIDDGELARYDDASQVELAINTYPGTRITEDDLTLEYLHRRIRRKTYRTTFWVTIPVKNKNRNRNTQ